MKQLKETLIRIAARLAKRISADQSTAAVTKIALRHLYQTYSHQFASTTLPRLSEAGFRNLSQFDEDGKLLCVFAALGIPVGRFVDIGAADGINSNCANLALNFGWHGTFIDGNAAKIARGRAFYASHPDTWPFPPQFVEAKVTRENVNSLMIGIPRDVDLLSIDIDGNDYWVWEALTAIDPKVVIIEAHIEFGDRSIVVPYDATHVHPGRHPQYFGASAPALVKLGLKKGFRLVGASTYGFNLIFVRCGLAERELPERSVAQALFHPRNIEAQELAADIRDWPYVEI